MERAYRGWGANGSLRRERARAGGLEMEISMKRLTICLVILLCPILLGSPVMTPQAMAGAGGCQGDIDGDGQVGIPDLLLLLADFGTCDGSPADLDGDTCVGVPDLLILLSNFGCGAAACLDNADCDDGDPCTFDLCILGSCFNFPIPDCP